MTFTTTTVERVGTKAVESDYQTAAVEGWERKRDPFVDRLGVRLIERDERASSTLPFVDRSMGVSLLRVMGGKVYFCHYKCHYF